MTAKDPYVGEIFEDRDTRSAGRRIRILEIHPDQDQQHTWKPSTRYRAIRVNELGQAVGRQRIAVSARTLDTHYRKVSH